MIASLEPDKVIRTIWDDNLDWEFKKNWTEDNRELYPVLHDQQAIAQQPFPYCVFEVQQRQVAGRMTGYSKTEKRQIVDVPVEFRVHAREMDESGKSAKQIAGELTDLVLAYYGGHPTVAPKTATLSVGNLLLVQYQSHFGVPTEENTYQMTINYLFRLDLPYQTG